MVPATLNDNNDSIYYPLQCPFANINGFKNNQSISTLTELKLLKNVLLAYQEEFTEEKRDTYDSFLYQISKKTKFSFYHYKSPRHHTIKDLLELLNIDSRFLFSTCDNKTNISHDAKLFRGCIRLSR